MSNQYAVRKNLFLHADVKERTLFYNAKLASPSSFARQEVVGLAGLEPATPRLSSACSNQLSYRPKVLDSCPIEVGGGTGTRTLDIQLAKLALYQLSYTPSLEVRIEKKKAKSYAANHAGLLRLKDLNVVRAIARFSLPSQHLHAGGSRPSQGWTSHLRFSVERR